MLLKIINFVNSDNEYHVKMIKYAIVFTMTVFVEILLKLLIKHNSKCTLPRKELKSVHPIFLYSTTVHCK